MGTRGKTAKINRKTARATRKPGTTKNFKNVTEARGAGMNLPNAAQRVKTSRKTRLDTTGVNMGEDEDND